MRNGACRARQDGASSPLKRNACPLREGTAHHGEAARCPRSVRCSPRRAACSRRSTPSSRRRPDERRAGGAARARARGRSLVLSRARPLSSRSPRRPRRSERCETSSLGGVWPNRSGGGRRNGRRRERRRPGDWPAGPRFWHAPRRAGTMGAAWAKWWCGCTPALELEWVHSNGIRVWIFGIDLVDLKPTPPRVASSRWLRQAPRLRVEFASALARN